MDKNGKNQKVDPLEFIVPANDNNGHSSRFWFRASPQMDRQVSQYVEGRQFPYRTKGDLLRHALWRHLHWLNDLGGISSVNTQVDLIIDLMRDEELSSDFLTVFEKLSRQINNKIGSGAKGEAIRMILMVKEHIKGMPDGYWRDRYVQELERNFGHLVAGSEKASLGRIED